MIIYDHLLADAKTPTQSQTLPDSDSVRLRPSVPPSVLKECKRLFLLAFPSLFSGSSQRRMEIFLLKGWVVAIERRLQRYSFLPGLFQQNIMFFPEISAFEFSVLLLGHLRGDESSCCLQSCTRRFRSIHRSIHRIHGHARHEAQLERHPGHDGNWPSWRKTAKNMCTAMKIWCNNIIYIIYNIYIYNIYVYI